MRTVPGRQLISITTTMTTTTATTTIMSSSVKHTFLCWWVCSDSIKFHGWLCGQLSWLPRGRGTLGIISAEKYKG